MLHRLFQLVSRREYQWLAVLMLAALLVHLAICWPGLHRDDPLTFFSRPDTSGYLTPALSMAAGRGYTGPAGMPHCERVPGYPVLLAAALKAGGLRHPSLLQTGFGLIAVLTAIPVYRLTRLFSGRRTALLAAALFLFHPTVIGNRPLLLSDTVFAFAAAWQVFWIVRFYREKRSADFLLAMAAAAAGTLIRPINSAWWFPALFWLALLPGLPPGRKWKLGLAGGLLFAAILLPWMARNAACGAGYSLDTNTGAMYHQNGAMLLARVNNSSFEAEKARILAELETEFADRERYPDEKSKTAFRLARFRELIAAHPWLWLSQHFQPRVLLPDFPAVAENLGLTRGNRGTLDVMQRHGIPAAIRHYFDGNMALPLLMAPLLIPVLLLGIGFAAEMICRAGQFRYQWPLLLLILAVTEYYFFLPGPITVPRYQLPALPAIAAFGAIGCQRIVHRLLEWLRRRSSSVR